MSAGALVTSAEMERKNISRLILVITLLLVFIMAARSPLDSDLWWHLRAGEETLTTGHPVRVDSFSYTRAGSVWTNHSWLGQVVLALVYRAGGFFGLGALVALVAAASMGLTFAQMQSPALLRAFLIILASTVAAPVWSPRPQLFSLLLLALTGWILYSYRIKNIDRLLWLLPLFVLWSNLHGGYPLGLVLVGAVCAGEALNHLTAAEAERLLSWRAIGRLALIGIASFLVTAINPNGFQMWLIPFKTVNIGVLQTLIQEWASPDFHDPAQLPMLVLLFLAIAAAGLAGKRRDGVDLAALMIFGGMALVARRNFGPFALVTAPVLSRALVDALSAPRPRLYGHPLAIRIANHCQRINASPASKAGPMPGKKIINLLIVALLGLAAAGKLVTVSQPALVQPQLEANYPVAAVEWIEANQPQGRLFNAYNWGGYLLWRLPQYSVFVDGRTDLFGDEILSQWITVVQAGEGWQQILDRWEIHLILLEPGRPVNALLPTAGWQLLASGEEYVLYGR